MDDYPDLYHLGLLAVQVAEKSSSKMSSGLAQVPPTPPPPTAPFPKPSQSIFLFAMRRNDGVEAAILLQPSSERE
jgi:hypothetical protein